MIFFDPLVLNTQTPWLTLLLVQVKWNQLIKTEENSSEGISGLVK